MNSSGEFRFQIIYKMEPFLTGGMRAVLINHGHLMLDGFDGLENSTHTKTLSWLEAFPKHENQLMLVIGRQMLINARLLHGQKQELQEI
ncbi:hypothetical protein KUTeg_013418 [Tegillarca granosa]|uniref:Uncharacterized protein n=1 Tax=Tegillarca granosa TaxID=220873 RepID=A0ABQ9ETM1_TEGGR|nr:hypothetical protein KUTeg_013418 [Tegillarca granosa]